MSKARHPNYYQWNVIGFDGEDYFFICTKMKKRDADAKHDELLDLNPFTEAKVLVCHDSELDDYDLSISYNQRQA